MVILEVSTCNSVDIEFRFIGAIVDEFCGLFETEEVTKLFKEYVDVTNCMCERCLKPDSTKSKLSKLEYRLVLFKKLLKRLRSIRRLRWARKNDMA